MVRPDCFQGAMDQVDLAPVLVGGFLQTAYPSHQSSNATAAAAETAPMTATVAMQTHKKGHPCPYCPYVSDRISYLKTHIRTHTGERPFKCPNCDKSFNLKADLTIHIRTHTGERPYACSMCPYRVSKSSNLKVHVLRKHGLQM